MNRRRIAAAAVTAWVVSIPFGAFMHHGVLGSVYAGDPPSGPTGISFEGCPSGMSFNSSDCCARP
jgi:hypothetical protein